MKRRGLAQGTPKPARPGQGRSRHDGGDNFPLLIRINDGFLTYIGTQLAPCLSAGDIVIMDNLSTHKVKGVRKLIEARGASLIYLPPYSPDLNPIEMAFAKLKALLGKAAERTEDALCQRIGQLLETFAPGECSNYLTHAGYDRA